MAISAVNSINFNRVAFKGTQSASKTETANKPQNDESFFKDNKETILTLAGIGAAVLGATMLVKSGKSNKAAAELSITDKNYTDTVGEKAINKIKNAVQTAKINEQIAEFGPDGARHAARIESKYEEVLPEIFAEGAKVNSREDLLTWAKVNKLKGTDTPIEPSDLFAWARVEGLAVDKAAA